MASQPPQKPWERRIPGTIPAPANYRSTEFGSSGLSRPGPPVLTRVAPPVPPRPVQQSGIGSLSTYRPAYSSYSSSYSPYGSSLFGGYSPYGYGGYGLGGGVGYNRFHVEDVPPSRFVQHAEESSRGAFQSIESIVHAFSSVSMMLDATFSAVYNSFRAVLDVANHFSRLRVHFTKVLSAFALVRSLRYLYRRLQRMMGLRRNSEVEDLWTDSAGTAVAAVAAGGAAADDPITGSVKSWPIFLFFAVILGGPYLIWKLLRSAEGEEERATSWANGDDDHVVARADFDFAAASEEEISVQAGDMLNLAPKEQQPRIRGWLLGSLDGQTTGLVPANYVKILGRRRGRRQAEQGRAEEQRRQQQAFQNPPPVPAQTAGSMNTAVTHGDPEVVFESVYREMPVLSDEGSFQSTSTSNTSVVTVPKRIDP
uniref:Peroxisomal membrane protein PEX13 n=1 Tax=Paramormyrops kingsleyae TaxID=1676925 RepID=A0A3B3RGI7_9TELE|nr:peroxisome biogenesis factor 13 [Paramormyrops kingsleyae]